MSDIRSIGDLLRQRAQADAAAPAYIFLSNRGHEEAVLTFADLAQRANAVAARLLEQGHPGERAALLFPPGLDFLIAFFGCLLAGIIAVPMMLPRRLSARDASASILRDADPRFALTNASVVERRPEVLRGIPGVTWIALESLAGPVADVPCDIAPDDIALLQYTSGSTSDPKGIEVTHRNLLANLEMIRRALGNTQRSTHVSWLPLYHDMGLILNVLQSFYLGAPCVLLAPTAFMQRPLAWLAAISHYRAEVAGGPNFGFDLCVSRFRPELMHNIDLSCWNVALNGAEPVRAQTLDRFASTFKPYGFSPRASYPAYGMAEATLLISGGTRDCGPVVKAVSRGGLKENRVAAPADATDAQDVVGCGVSLDSERIAIVCPERRLPLAPNEIGEIWVQGPNVCRGYWRNREATEAAFHACMDQEPNVTWLRTGDLGFLDPAGELFVTGRLKDLIIIRGANHYPQDIEDCVQASHAALRRHGGAAFAIVDSSGDEKLVVVQEVERGSLPALDIDDVVGSIREALAEERELAAHAIVLIRPGTIPKTTSGKIQRRLTRDQWQAGTLAVVGGAHADRDQVDAGSDPSA